MTKRILSLLLALITVVTLLPPVSQVRAATEEDFAHIVTKRYDEFAASIHQKDADDKAIDELLKPAFYGNGSTVVFDKNDAITAALYESALFREVFIKAVSAGITSMQDAHQTRLMSYAVCAWYDFRNYYSIRQHVDEDYGKDEIPSDETRNMIYYNVPVPEANLAATPNKCDTALGLVVGGSNVRFLMEQTDLTDETATYHVRIRWTDSFDFKSNYSKLDEKGYNTAFAKLLSLMGAFLRLKSFHWRSETELTITVPNTCTHSGGGKYRWEKVGNDLVHVSGNDLLENAAARQTYTTDSDKAEKYYYKLDRGIELLHDAPWYIEFQADARSTFYLGPEIVYTYSQLPQLLKNSESLNVFETVRTPVVHPQTGKLVVSSDRHLYGLNFDTVGAPTAGDCIYRIENRIAPDGTNSLWLLINGEEMGCLADYSVYKSVENATYAAGKDPQWYSGKNYTVRYIFNAGYAFTDTMKVSYLEIDTACGYTVSEEIPGSCTQGTGIKTRCILCGLETVENTQEALGHTSQVIPGKEATCHETGLTDGALCAVCGETLQEQTELPMLSHEGTPLEALAPTCLEAGLTEGSVCALCDELLVPQQSVPALGHSLEKGKCIRCGYLDYLPGDVNGDGVLNYADALTVLRVSIGLETNDSRACDMNGDGTVNYSDALMILRTSIGLE